MEEKAQSSKSKARSLKKDDFPKKGKKSKKVSSFSLPEIDLRKMLEAGCHFGHRVSKTHPKIRPFLYGARGGIQIFDLIKTAQQLKKAGEFIAEFVEKGGKIVFVGTKRQARELVREVATECDMPYVVERWLGGTITNWEQIHQRIEYLNRLREDYQKGVYKKRTKKEQADLRREIARLEKNFGGLKSLDSLPECLFIVDTVREKTAVVEANKKGVKTVAIVDSNADPTLIDYPIPANDDAKKSISFILGWIKEVIKGSKVGKEEEK